MSVVIIAVWAVAGLAVGVRAVRRWRDRRPGTTIVWLAVAWGLLLIPVGVVAGEAVLLVMLLTLFFGFPALAGVVELRQRHARLQTRHMAIAGGMPDELAHREYRREPRGPGLILLIYVVAAATWVAVAFGISVIPGNADLASEPAWTVSVGEGEPFEMPWWMIIMAGIEAAGVVHATVNMFRRS